MGKASTPRVRRGEIRGWLGGSAIALPVFLSGCMLAGQPPDDASTADAVPKSEPRSKFGNPPFYTALGRRYTVLASADGYVARGVASWYGPDFHGKRASSGETYNMYTMTAAHPTLPLPSYVKVTNLENGRSAIVRINDRGPFKSDRIIDLSYAAARKLGVWQNGTAFVEVRAITPPRDGDEADRIMLSESVPASKPVVLNTTRVVSTPVAASYPSSASSVVTTALPQATPLAPVDETAATGTVALATVSSQALTEPYAPIPHQAVSMAPIAPVGASMYIQVGAFSLYQNADAMRSRLLSAGMPRVEIVPSDTDSLYRVRVGPVAGNGEADRLISVLEGNGISTHKLVSETADATVARAP